MRRRTVGLLAVWLGGIGTAGVCQTPTPDTAPAKPAADTGAKRTAASGVKASKPKQSKSSRDDAPANLPSGTARLWTDRGSLTPTQVFWGEASREKDPATRLPAPPFSNFQKDAEGTSPKCRMTDKNGVKWTVKFGEEVHADVAAPRLAWALGFGTDENYYVHSGKLDGLTGETDLGKCKPYIAADGTFAEARFKRHDKQIRHVQGTTDKDEKDSDATWDERKNPGLPPEQLSGLLILEVMTHNWDAQPKNNKIIAIDAPDGPQNWFIVSDWGASFGALKTKGNLKEYQKETSFVRKVDAESVYLKFDSIIKSMAPVHEKIPIAHARWFRKQLEKLTDADLRAAFQAAYATDAAYKAYAAGQPADNSAFDSLTAATIDGYVTTFRAKIEEFKSKVSSE